jgi:hydroxypyruvate isomerase
MDRRAFLAASGAAALSPALARAATAGRFKQGVARVVFGDMPLEDCCRLAVSLGIKGFDLISDPKDWPTLKRHGLVMSMLRADYGGGVSIGRSPPGPPGWGAIGLKEAQGAFLAAIHEAIEVAAREGFPNLILTAGTRDAVSYEEGAENAVAFLNLVKGHAEQKGVTLCLELLNSFGVQAPKNSLFDHAAWGFDVMRRVNSPRAKVLYDIWHAQLMDGNIAQTIRDNIALIGHIHTGGVPGRHELFRDNELDYGFLARVIAGTGFDGFVTHEWSPSPGSDIAEDLRRSVELMSV